MDLFCKIIKGDIPSYKVYEDDYVMAFLDINPKKPGHTLIIPKKHFDDFTSLDEEYLIHINNAAKKVVDLLTTKLKATGFCLNTNYLDTQEIKHYHLHIVPMTNINLSVEEIYNILKQ